jgi:hypothetical protein
VALSDEIAEASLAAASISVKPELESLALFDSDASVELPESDVAVSEPSNLLLKLPPGSEIAYFLKLPP